MKSFTIVGTYVLDAGTPVLNGVTWTLSVELFLYALFFVVTWNARKCRTKIIPYLVLVLVSTLFVNLYLVNIPLLNFYVACGVLSFFMGCLICELYRALQSFPKGSKVGHICLIGIILYVFSWFYPGIDFYSKTNSSQAIFYSCVIMPMLFLSILQVPLLSRLLSCKPLQLLGAYSFSIYLIHYPLLSLISVLHKYGIISFQASNPFNLLIVVSVSLLLSIFSYHCFERPVQKWIREKYHKHQRYIHEKHISHNPSDN